MTGAMLKVCGGVLAVLVFCLACCASSSLAAAPPNDDFSNAQVLSGALPIEASGTNVGATFQESEPTQTIGMPGRHSVWFRWEATATEIVTVDACAQMNPIIGIYVGSTLGALAEVPNHLYTAERGVDGCGFNRWGIETFKAIAGRTYAIQVDGSTDGISSEPAPTGEGSFELSIVHQPPPANDDFAAAEPIPLDHQLTWVSNLGATKEPGEPDHGGDAGGASVWYQFTALKTHGVSLWLEGGPGSEEVGAGSGEVGVYTGDTVGGLTSVPTSEIEPGRFAFPATAGVTYRIALDGRFSPATETPYMGEWMMGLSSFPSNDSFEEASALFEGGPLGFGFMASSLGNVGATMQPGEPDPGGVGGSSVWFKWTAPESGSLYLGTCSATFHTILTVYVGSSLTGLTQVASSDAAQVPPCNPLGPSSGPPPSGFNVGGGAEYRIAVDGYEGASGSFGIQMQTSKKLIPAPQQGAAAAAPWVARPPRTKIASRHLNRGRGIAVFTLRSSQPDSTFRCRLDSHPFRVCGSDASFHGLRAGRHNFEFKAVNSAGEADPTAAVFHLAPGRRGR